MSDQNVREQVRSEFSKNYCLSAGAGAGKTEELTRRAAHWLIYGAPSGLSAIERQQGLVLLTFTEAGAGEMGDRIEGLLHQLAHAEGWTETTPGLAAIGTEIEGLCDLDQAAIQKRATALLDGPSIRVSTFHAFCLDLLRDYGETIGLPARLELEPNDKALAVVRRAMAWETLADETALGNQGLFERPIRSDWVVQILCELSRSPWLPNDQLDTIRSLIGEQEAIQIMAGLVTDLRRLQDHFPAFGSGAKNRIAKMNALLEDAQTKDPNWEELAKELGAFAKIKAVPSEEFKLRMLELRDRCALKARWKPEFWDQLLPHVPRLLRTLRAKQVFHRRIGFDDALRYAVELLRSRPGVRRICRQQIRQMMVDEFQDTDPLQCELLRSIHQDDQGRFTPGRLFIVGDDKQSIYGFRGADLQAYQLFCAELFEAGAKALELKRNFRSDHAVLNTVAHGFQEHFGQAAQMQARDHAHPGSVRFLGWHAPPSRELSQARFEIQNGVAALIAERLRDEPGLRPSDCAILARTRAQIDDWCAVLTAHGVPAIAVGGRDGLEHEAMQDLLNLFAFMSGHSDSASFFGLLQGPLFNWEQWELQRALSSGLIHDEHIERCDLEHRCAELAALFALRALYQQGALTVLKSQLLVNNWCPGPWINDSQTHADLIRLMDNFFTAVSDPTQDLLLWLERHREAPDFAPAALASDGVVVMTLHGAKGLEWPWVVAASMPRGGGGGRSDPSETHDRKIAINLSRGPWIGPLLSIRAAKKEQRITEDRRLAYVACTRARNDLWIVGCSQGADDPLDDLVFDAERRGECEHLERLRFVPQETIRLTRFKPSLTAPLDWQVARPLSVSPSQIDAEQGERHRRADAREDEPTDQPSQQRTIATAVGELVHLVLEQLDFSLPMADQIVGSTERALAQMMEQLPSEHMAEIFESAHDALNRFAQTPLAEEFEHLEIVARELAFTCPASWLDPNSSARMGTGFIDLIYRRGDGRLVVADWKVTSETRHDELVERYQHQLEAYRRVVQKLCPDETIETELILVRTGERLVLSHRSL